MSKRAGIAGAGLSGRLMAEALSHAGWEVSLFDPDSRAGERSCGHTGAGMLAPYCELEHAEPAIAELGVQSLALWPDILARLVKPVFFQHTGSLVVAHPNDQGELDRLKREVLAHSPDPEVMQPVGGRELGELEPELAGRFAKGLFFPQEGQVDNLQLMDSLRATLEARHVSWTTEVSVEQVRPGELELADGSRQCFDWAIDCRGLGAQVELPKLRGVRGEIVRLSAPEVTLQRPVRLMHPRYPIYIVPREQHYFVIGATSIESDDRSPVSVRSLLELLSAGYTVHSGFAEARVLHTEVNCRPAFADNLPRLDHEPGLLRLNGLYRHGFLLSPALVEQATEILSQG